MGLQLVIQPSSGVAWSKNPSKLSFVKRGIITTLGRCAQFLLVIADSDRPVSGQTLILSWTGTQITFTFGSAAPSDPTQLTLWSGSLAVCGRQLVRDLLRHPTLAQYFNVTLLSATGGYATILIQALNKGTQYSLSHTGSTMPIYSSSALTTGVNEVIPDDYKLYMLLQMVVGKLTEPQQSGQLSLEAVGVLDDTNDRMQLDFYDLKEVGRAMLQTQLPFSAFKPYLQPMAIAYAQIALSEYYNGQSWKSQIDNFSDINGYIALRILNGGIALVNYPPTVPTTMIGATTGQFLTSQNRRKVLDAQQPEWLTIYLPSTAGTEDDWSILFTIYYTDGTNETKLVGITDQSVLDSIFTIPTGWTQNNLVAVDASKVASYYTAQVVDSAHADPYSEVMTYILDTRYFRQVRYFIVLNSLGGWDTVRTVGNNQLSSKYTRTTNDIAETMQTRASDGTIQMSVNEEEQTWTMRSGWLMSRQDAEYYRELLLSTYVAEILTPLIPNSGSAIFKQIFRSLIVQPSSMSFYEDTDSKWSIEWKMNYAVREINYSQLAPASEPYFDSTVEVTIISSTYIDSIQITSTADNIQYIVNGVITALSGGYLPLAINIENHVIINAENLTALTINASSGFDEIDINRIASATLTTLSVTGFIEVSSDYLVERLQTLYALQSLTIDTYSIDTDAILIAALQLYQGGLVSLNTLSLPSSTPSSVGYAAKATLVASGITVNTL